MSEERINRLQQITMTEKELEKSMKIKEQRRSKAEMIKNFSLCDTLSTEIRGLIKEKHVLENERKVLQRKESQPKWFLKRKSALQTEGEKRNEQILLKRKPVSMTLESMWSRKKEVCSTIFDGQQASLMANDVVCLSSVVPRATPNQAEDDGDIEVLSPPVTSVTPNQAENDRDVEVLSAPVTSVTPNQAEDDRDVKVLSPLVTRVTPNKAEDDREIEVLSPPVTSVTPNQAHEDDRDIEVLSPPVTSVTPNEAEDDGDIEVLSTPVASVTPNKAEDDKRH
ncbi:Hypothetical predicted protein [Paramuricea clavata]|uniref:Uncharacterized protein n=1 Tax=Paramuricea clavata TaxID=317549 RepID=A0A7D9DD43_PARCT|nr:Hypothetical predicted protein [Paramuricea clavata]